MDNVLDFNTKVAEKQNESSKEKVKQYYSYILAKRLTGELSNFSQTNNIPFGSQDVKDVLSMAIQRVISFEQKAAAEDNKRKSEEGSVGTLEGGVEEEGQDNPTT